MKLFIDIETIGTDRADVRDYIAAGVTHPANISKPETIAKWNEESRPQAVADAIAKTALDGAFGRVCVIGYAIEDNEPVTLWHATDEALILREFAVTMDIMLHGSRVVGSTVIGHNIASFDLRFLLQRYIVNGIRPPQIIARAAAAKPWDTDKVFDTMAQWNPERDKRISLDKLCLALGIPSPKGDMDGSMVGQYVADGRIMEVADYCKRDVLAVREVYRRMTFANVARPELEDVPA